MQRYEKPVAMDAAMGYLKAALPLADRLTLTDAALERVARHALMVRESTPWGADIPEDIFAAYVLFPRVNNESPQFYHETLWRQLRARISALSMEQAVLEINLWCCEQATYQSTDDRTAGPLTVIRRGFGRCGEESVLLVCALRSCGIPARQVYAPWWSHCDDNHAWVEAWVDGRWRYLGACEPEPELDSGWFTAAASKAMLTHTRAWGVLPAGERAEKKVDNAYIINRTAAYARTRLLTVQVIEGGKPRAGLRVCFQVANMAQWRSLCEKTTDADGMADLLVGQGTVRVRVTDGTRFLRRDVDTAVDAHCLMDFAMARHITSVETTFIQRPPLESRMQNAGYSPKQLDTLARRVQEADAGRAERFAGIADADPLIRAARGNHEVVAAFLADDRFDPEDARALLESLREKDLADVTPEVLEDAMFTALPHRGIWPREVWVEGILCPRVSNEMLYPVRRRLADRVKGIGSAGALWDFIHRRMGLCRMTPEGLVPDLAAALEYGWCDELQRDMLFIACARSLGMPARLDPLTGVKQVWQGGEWQALLPEEAPTARLTLRNGSGRALTAGEDFSLCRLEQANWRTIGLWGSRLTDAMTLPLVPGCYRAMATQRQIDGGVDGREYYLRLEAGGESECTLVLPPDDTADRLLYAPLPPLACLQGDAPVELPEALGGRPAIVALIAPGQEPTEHFLNELLEASDALEARGIAVRLIVRQPEALDNAGLRQALAGLPDALCLTAPDEAALLEWRERLRAGELRLPLAVAVGRDGAGLFAFVNYNVGSVKRLLQILDVKGEG